MTWFRASRESQAVVAADRDAVWAILTDADTIVKLTPLLERIDVDGDRWVWHLGNVKVLGRVVSPVFTELMTFEDRTSITYTHAPPEGADERAGVEGLYELADTEGGTDLRIRLEVSVDLPFPRVTSPAVTAAMKAVIAGMGAGFAKRLNAELGLGR